MPDEPPVNGIRVSNREIYDLVQSIRDEQRDVKQALNREVQPTLAEVKKGLDNKADKSEIARIDSRITAEQRRMIGMLGGFGSALGVLRMLGFI